MGIYPHLDTGMVGMSTASESRGEGDRIMPTRPRGLALPTPTRRARGSGAWGTVLIWATMVTCSNSSDHGGSGHARMPPPPHPRGEGGGGRGAPWLQSERLFKAERVGLFLRGASTSERVNTALTALHELKKPNSKLLSRKHAARADAASPAFTAAAIEQLCGRYGASMFGIGSHTKRRPDHLTLGRLFDGQILDSFDLAIQPSLIEPPESDHPARTATIGSTPCFVFLGQAWQRDTRLSEFKNLLIDSLGVRHEKELHLRAVERAIVCCALNGSRVHLAQYTVDPDRAAEGEAELSPTEASFTFDVRESSRLADTQVMRRALRLKDPSAAADKKSERSKGVKKARKRVKIIRKVGEEMKRQGKRATAEEVEAAAASKGAAKAKPLQTIDIHKVFNAKKARRR